MIPCLTSTFLLHLLFKGKRPLSSDKTLLESKAVHNNIFLDDAIKMHAQCYDW